MTAYPLDCVPESDLARFVHGALDTEHLQQIATHVDGCETCQDTVVALAEYSDTFVESIRDAGARLPEPQDGALRLGLKRMLNAIRVSVTNNSAAHGSVLSSPLDRGDAKHLGPYAVLEQLGSGGMGNVYRATHTKLKRTVALKVLPANRWSNTIAVSRFEREMEAIGQLDHPNIVRASDAGEDKDMHYLVMEYVDGLDLSRLVNRLGPLPVAEACELARQAAIGLHYTHENGLVHRDIKPSNLMLAWGRANGPTANEAPTVKILDLGLALLGDEHLREGHELTTVGTLMGTLDYMSPEQGVDSHSVDQRTDVYGLGATLFKLLTGRAPYADPRYGTLMKKMTALATKPAPSICTVRDELPDALVSIVDRMLSRDPDERFDSAEEAAEALAPLSKDADLAKLLRRGLSTEEPIDNVTPRVSVTALATESPTIAVAQAKSNGDRSTSNPFWPLLFAAGFLAIAAGIIFHLATDYGDVTIRSTDPDATVVVKRGDHIVHQLRIENGEEKLRLRTGRYDIEVIGDAEVSVRPSSIEVARRGSSDVEVAKAVPDPARPAAIASPGALPTGEYAVLHKLATTVEIEALKDEISRLSQFVKPDSPQLKQLQDEISRLEAKRQALHGLQQQHSAHSQSAPLFRELDAQRRASLEARVRQLEMERYLAKLEYEAKLRAVEVLGKSTGELEAKQQQLREMRSQFGPKHPKIRSIETEIKALADRLGTSDTERITALQESRISELNAAQRRQQKLDEEYSQMTSRLQQVTRDGLIGPDSRLLIQVLGTTPERPIAGTFRLEPSGNVHLGPGYGRVRIEGMKLEEAEIVIKEHLKKYLNAVDVMVTVPHSDESLNDQTSQDPSLQDRTSTPAGRQIDEPQRKLLAIELRRAQASLKVCESELAAGVKAQEEVPGTITKTELIRLNAQREMARLEVQRIKTLIDALDGQKESGTPAELLQEPWSHPQQHGATTNMPEPSPEAEIPAL